MGLLIRNFTFKIFEDLFKLFRVSNKFVYFFEIYLKIKSIFQHNRKSVCIRVSFKITSRFFQLNKLSARTVARGRCQAFNSASTNINYFLSRAHKKGLSNPVTMKRCTNPISQFFCATSKIQFP